MASTEIDIKQAIDNGDIAAVRQWLGSSAGKKAAAPITPTTAARHWDVSNARPANTKVNKQIPSDADSKVMETPLQYAGRMGKGDIVEVLIAAGARVDVELNEHTRAFNDKLQKNFLKGILDACKQPIKNAEVDLSAKRRDLHALLSTIRDPSHGKIYQHLTEQEPTTPQIKALWDVIERFETALNLANDVDKANEARTQFLANVALLSSYPAPSVAPKPKPASSLKTLQEAANELYRLIGKEQEPSKKDQLKRIRKTVQHLIQRGTVINPDAEAYICAHVMYFAKSDPDNCPEIDYWTAILNLSVKAWDVLKQLESEWSKSGLSEIEQSKRHNLGILGNDNFRGFLDHIFQKVKSGTIAARSPKYQNMLKALHTLFRSPELTPQQIQSVANAITDNLHKKDDSAVMDAVTAQIFNLCPPLPARPKTSVPPKVPGPVRTISDANPRSPVAPSYSANPKKLPDWNPPKKPVTRSYDPPPRRKLNIPSNLKYLDLARQEGPSLPKNLSRTADALDLAVGRSHQVGGGTVNQTDPLGWKAINARADGISSFYNAMERVYKRLQQGEGYKYFSLPEMELFSQVQELLKDKDYLQSIQIDGKTIWETLNPEGARVFKVRQLVEPADGETKSPLTKAIEQHKQYELEFKASLSQPGGIYNPPDKKYYIQRGADDRYHVMVKGGQTLSKKEMDEAARELIIITRDMTGNIDVNVRIHSAVSEADAKDLAAIVLILGATVDKTANVVKEEDKHIHSVVEKHAEEMQKTASAPEFSVKDKQRELWATVRKSDIEMNSISKAAHISQEIQEKEYRVMSADGMRRMPEARDITEDDQKIYWEKKRELQTRPDWNYVDAGDIVTSVLRSVVRETSSVTTAAAPELSDGVIAHLMPLGTDVQMRIEQENRTRSQEWLEESRSQRSGQYSNEFVAKDEEKQVNPDDGSLSQKEEKTPAPNMGDVASELKSNPLFHRAVGNPETPLTKSSTQPESSAPLSNPPIITTSDGNCLLHTIVLVLKARFKELQKETGYDELSIEYSYKYGGILDEFLSTADQNTIEKVLSPILRPLAVRWFFEDAELRNKVIEEIVTAWSRELRSTVENGRNLNSITAEDLKNYIDLLPPGLDLDDDLVERIKEAAFNNPEGLRAIVNDKIFPAMCRHYHDTTANLPPEIAVAAWRRLATNVSLTYTDTQGVSVTTPGASGSENVDVKLIWSSKRDVDGNGTGHYDVQIGNAVKQQPPNLSSQPDSIFGGTTIRLSTNSTQNKTAASQIKPPRHK